MPLDRFNATKILKRFTAGIFKRIDARIIEPKVLASACA
jgi:hypothetical protein